MKNKKHLMTINFILIVYIFTLCTGYAFFNESLTVDGVASTVEYYEGQNLPLTATIRDTSNNRYYTANDSKKFLDFHSETWSADTYNLYFKKKTGLVLGEKTITYTVTITNPTALKFTGGTISTSIDPNANYLGCILSVSGSLSKLEVAPGESVDVNLTVRFNFPSAVGDNRVISEICYDLQNKKRCFNFKIEFNNFTWG